MRLILCSSRKIVNVPSFPLWLSQQFDYVDLSDNYLVWIAIDRLLLYKYVNLKGNPLDCSVAYPDNFATDCITSENQSLETNMSNAQESATDIIDTGQTVNEVDFRQESDTVSALYVDGDPHTINNGGTAEAFIVSDTTGIIDKTTGNNSILAAADFISETGVNFTMGYPTVIDNSYQMDNFKTENNTLPLIQEKIVQTLLSYYTPRRANWIIGTICIVTLAASLYLMYRLIKKYRRRRARRNMLE